MVWAGICSDKLMDHNDKVDDGVKLTSQSYYKFLDKTFFKSFFQDKMCTHDKLCPIMCC